MNLERKLELERLMKIYFRAALSHVDRYSEMSEQLRKSFSNIPINEEAELPGYESRPLKFGKFENREFVVMMTDIRGSTNIINEKNGLVNMFLIFYIYAGLVANIVDKYKGTSTEFLGDGVLNLFDTEELGRDDALCNSMQASMDIMDVKDSLLNPFLESNGIPKISLGIGIDHGLTIVTKFGYRNDTDLKAFGRCAYHASKLCKEVNKIVVSQNSRDVWPSGPNGRLTFDRLLVIEGKSAYSVSRIN
jgi:class 3 adenylate cyclase